jgi:AcrR family transcriptional regulator
MELVSFSVSRDRIQLSQEILMAAIGDDWPPDQVDAAIDLLAGGEGRFPSGTRKLPADLVKTLQRERLLVAMLNAASELGYRAANVQDVIERAGVSRPTFYEHFSNKEDCFLAAFDTSAARLRAKVDAAAAAGGDVWRERVRLGLEAIVAFFRAEPDTARALIVEARAASSAAVVRRVRLIDAFAGCLDSEARTFLPADPPPSPLTAAGVVGGIEALLYSRLCKEEFAELEALLPSLVYFVVLPYEGHAAAGAELAAHSS